MFAGRCSNRCIDFIAVTACAAFDGAPLIEVQRHVFARAGHDCVPTALIPAPTVEKISNNLIGQILGHYIFKPCALDQSLRLGDSTFFHKCVSHASQSLARRVGQLLGIGDVVQCPVEQLCTCTRVGSHGRTDSHQPGHPLGCDLPQASMAQCLGKPIEVNKSLEIDVRMDFRPAIDEATRRQKSEPHQWAVSGGCGQGQIQVRSECQISMTSEKLCLHP